jgi:hypothetical protein
MSYDNWKSTNPADDELGSQPQPGQNDEPIEEPGRLERGKCYNPRSLRLRGWWTPLGYRHAMPGYDPMEYFEGLYDGPARYLGPDSFGVEPLFEQE